MLELCFQLNYSEQVEMSENMFSEGHNIAGCTECHLHVLVPETDYDGVQHGIITK